MKNRQAVEVIGGGFTGTLAAYLLSKKGHAVTLYDCPPDEVGTTGQPILGGMIRTQALARRLRVPQNGSFRVPC